MMQKMDGFDDCVLGVCSRFGRDPVIAYDYDMVIKKHMDEGMTYDEAVKCFEYNQIGAWVGDGTPCFVRKATMDAIDDEVDG